MQPSTHSLAGQALLTLSEEMSSSGAGPELQVARMLERLFRGTHIRHVNVDPRVPNAAVSSSHGRSDEITAARLLAVVDDHPMIRSYLPLKWSNCAPRRMSDLITQREFLKTRTYWELFRPIGATHQMTIMTSVRQTRGTAWVINRSGSDFRERELEIAAALQPVLALLESASYRSPRTSQCDEPSLRSRSFGLTGREVQVLGLVADGLTALQISRALRISVATVNKHLQHVYDKLDAHDRLVAVNRARAAGILPWDRPAGSSTQL